MIHLKDGVNHPPCVELLIETRPRNRPIAEHGESNVAGRFAAAKLACDNAVTQCANRVAIERPEATGKNHSLKSKARNFARADRARGTLVHFPLASGRRT
jgi:hypothetical protein